MTDPTPALLLTRPCPESEAFLAALREMVTPGAVVISPVLRIVARDRPPDMQGIDAVIFTSANAVRSYGGPTDLPAWCVGRKTTDTARACGFAAQYAGENAEALVQTLIALRPSGKLLHLRGAHARGDIAGRLSHAGLRVGEAVIYDQRACPLSDAAQALLLGEEPVILPLFSPRSAAIVAEQVEPKAPLWVVAISAAVAEPAARLSPRVLRIAENPDLAAVCRQVAALYHRPSSLEGG